MVLSATKKLVLKWLNKLGYGLVKAPPDWEKETRKITRQGKKIVERISPDFEILNGPFKGLRFPSLEITELALVPKIVGSYESQLHPFIERIRRTKYTDIIDVGSAEGYYAVGLARLMPETIVHCFDINERDLQFCKAMASYNGLHNLTYNNLCTPDTLLNMRFNGRGLIFSDCEGFELELFSKEVIVKLKNVDLLIELHDVHNPIISSEILSRFQSTHHFEIVNNLNSEHPSWKGLESLTDEEKEFATLEHRGGLYKDVFMEWAFLTAKGS